LGMIGGSKIKINGRFSTLCGTTARLASKISLMVAHEKS
jgi:hypothetical protein